MKSALLTALNTPALPREMVDAMQRTSYAIAMSGIREIEQEAAGLRDMLGSPILSEDEREYLSARLRKTEGQLATARHWCPEAPRAPH